MEAICSSETSVDIQLTKRRYIPEYGTLHNHRCDNLKSYNKIVVELHIVWLVTRTGFYVLQIVSPVTNVYQRWR
jgi:hypothetical protein